MKTIIETSQIEFDKSDFLIDLVKYHNGQLYVEIEQIILNSNEKSRIKINPLVLSEIIKVLQNYYAKLSKESQLEQKFITDIDQDKIVKRYLKGVSIEDLAIQFDSERELIEMILRNKGCEIVENKLVKPKFWKQKRRRK